MNNINIKKWLQYVKKQTTDREYAVIEKLLELSSEMSTVILSRRGEKGTVCCRIVIISRVYGIGILHSILWV